MRYAPGRLGDFNLAVRFQQHLVMDLKAWIDLERGRQTKLAAEIGAQPQLVWQWAHGKRPIPADRRPDIERATGGAVTCEEMTSDEVVWSRISDAHWKWHPLGRPVRDLTRARRG